MQTNEPKRAKKSQKNNKSTNGQKWSDFFVFYCFLISFLLHPWEPIHIHNLPPHTTHITLGELRQRRRMLAKTCQPHSAKKKNACKNLRTKWFSSRSILPQKTPENSVQRPGRRLYASNQCFVANAYLRHCSQQIDLCSELMLSTIARWSRWSGCVAERPARRCHRYSWYSGAS